MIQFLSLEQLLVIHHDQVERYGGSHGIRDLAGLESALFRPQSSFGDEDLYPSLFDKAAALMHSLILNHPFLDANKRTGIMSGIIFLEINGKNLKVEQKELVDAALKIAEKVWNIEQISQWLKDHC